MEPAATGFDALVHAIGHALGGVSHVPHGYAMSILLPYCMEYNYEVVGNLYWELLQYFIGLDETAKIPREQRGRKCIEKVQEMLSKLNEVGGLPLSFREVNVSKEDFDKIVETAINDGAAMVNYKTKVPLEALKKKYYKRRRWDKEGIPKEKLLNKLEI